MDHYQYNGQQTPPVNRNSYGNQIWYIWGPIVVKIVIGMIVSGVASAAIGAAYMIRHEQLLSHHQTGFLLFPSQEVRPT